VNAFETNSIREKYRLSWDEEYIIGMVNNFGNINTMSILDEADKVMSPATAHKWLTSAHKKKLLLRKRTEDKRSSVFYVSEKGKKILREIGDAYVGN